MSRLPELKLRRVNDTCYVDTFFLSVKSVCGFTCWTQYSFKKSGYDAAYLMQRRSQGPSTLPKMVTDCGAPSLIKSDNAPEFKGKTWVDYLRKHQIPSQFTEAFHQNENYCECRGGAIKAAVSKCRVGILVLLFGVSATAPIGASLSQSWLAHITKTTRW
jgi:hypothetical protein